MYTDYINKQKARPVIVNVNMQDEYISAEGEVRGTEGSDGTGKYEADDRSLRAARSLGETVIASGRNYIVTTASKYPGALNNLSILVYNFSEVVGADLKSAPSREASLDIIRKYDEEMEFLIRCSGLSGEFKVSRYKMFQNKVISDLEDVVRPRAIYSRREELIRQWTSLPVIEFGQLTSSDTLSLRSTLKGFSAELLLVDEK